MSQSIDAPRPPGVPRNAAGQLLKGSVLNPLGAPPRLRFNRDRLVSVCDKNNYEPIGELIELARSRDATPYLKYEIHKEIASFLYSKRKAVSITNEDGEQCTIKISWDDTPAEQKRQFDKGMRQAEGIIMDAILDDDNPP